MRSGQTAEQQLKYLLQQGLPLTSRPYQVLAQQTGMQEEQVLQLIGQWQQEGLIRRMGAIVDHHRLGYSANAMVVFDVPGSQADELGAALAASGQVSLCYRRPRRPGWPYNLFCMIHGRCRDQVLQQIAQLKQHHHLAQLPSEVLFSKQQFKQCGGDYFLPAGQGVQHHD